MSPTENSIKNNNNQNRWFCLHSFGNVLKTTTFFFLKQNISAETRQDTQTQTDGIQSGTNLFVECVSRGLFVIFLFILLQHTLGYRQ